MRLPIMQATVVPLGSIGYNLEDSPSLAWVGLMSSSWEVDSSGDISGSEPRAVLQIGVAGGLFPGMPIYERTTQAATLIAPLEVDAARSGPSAGHRSVGLLFARPWQRSVDTWQEAGHSSAFSQSLGVAIHNEGNRSDSE